MSKIVVTHKVEDVSIWKAFEAERIENLGAFGTDVQSYVDSNGGADVAVALTVTDADGLQAFMHSDACRALMDKHGVVQPVTMLTLNG
jgi:hypothetical protein